MPSDQLLSRRDALKLAGSSLVLPALAAAPEQSFHHRSYLGWITDLSTQPGTNEAWPSMRLDAALLDDYDQTFKLLQELGFNELSVWGLYVANDWPLDPASAVTPERARMVQRMIVSAHRHGIKVLNGFGLYSWGYRKIIEANPHLNGGNPNAMCASEPDSWDWARKLIDFTFTRFPVDGTSMQSADLGRCSCSRCIKWGDMEYHARINIRAAEYILSRWPEKVIGVSGWGMKLQDPANQHFIVDMSRHIDYLIDVPGTTESGDGYRPKLIKALKCDFGTIGGWQVEPPQHWKRERWFLPTVRTDAQHLDDLYRDGGRACEYFYHILANPGDELSTYVTGKRLKHPGVPWHTHLTESIESIYRVTRSTTVSALAEAFLDAENAYTQYLPPHRCGTISLEPLTGSAPGEPVYLNKRLTAVQREAYSNALVSVAARFQKLAPDVPEKTRIPKILASIVAVQRDLGHPERA